ncbi:MAG: AI-2E family transporter [Halobacteria archaeon]|nr:AI-2E family transporter [Halobacteria archaeon]
MSQSDVNKGEDGGQKTRLRADLLRRVGFGVLLILLLGTVTYVITRFTATAVFTVFLYYASRPIHKSLKSLSDHRFLGDVSFPYQSRARAAATILIFLIPFVALLGYTVSLLVPEIRDALGEGYVPDIGVLPTPTDSPPLTLESIRGLTVSELRQLANDDSVRRWLTTASESISNTVTAAGGVLLRGFLVFSGTYYLLADGSRLRNWLLDMYDSTGIVETYADAVDRELSLILFGNILNAFVTAIIGIGIFYAYNYVAPEAVEVPYPALVGALTGAGSLIPVVGMKIVYLPVAAYMGTMGYLSAGVEVLVFVAVFVTVTLVVVDLVPDFLVRPYVSGKHTHMGLLMFAYILGPAVFGFYGIFLGPILLVVTSQFVRVVGPYVVHGDLPQA